jgi:uncharacterized protein (DUF433 family)
MDLAGNEWLVADPGLLGGKAVIRGTRLSAAFIPECLAGGMGPEEITETYAPFPKEALPEIMKPASEQASQPTRPRC